MGDTLLRAQLKKLPDKGTNITVAGVQQTFMMPLLWSLYHQ
jgi:hypothetical protein